ncbi:MAG: hypothetical protein Q9227_001415 [Pyrenula ochraceoflavens]
MESLIALGVVCNVLQVIDSTIKAVEVCKQVYEHGASVDNQDLEQRASLIAANSKTLRDSECNLGTGTAGKGSELQDVAKKCLAISDDLHIKLLKLKKKDTDGLTATLKKQLKTLWHRRDIEKIEQKMEKFQNILQSTVLTYELRGQAKIILNQQEYYDRLDATLQTFLQRLAEGCSSLSDLIRSEEDRTRWEIQQNTRHVKDHLDDRLDSLQDDQASERQRQRLLQSLKFPNMNARRNDIDNVEEGTFSFALENDGAEKRRWSSLPEFLHGEGKLYWIQGKPGSGKSTLMKMINEDDRTGEALSQWKPGQSILRLSFFFWLASTDLLQRSSKGLWCSLLYQLLFQTQLVDRLLAQERWLTQKDTVGDWSIQELSNTFLAAMRQWPIPVFVLLDGLDEFNPEEGALEIINHVETLSTLPCVKMLISSRPEIDIERELQAKFGLIPQMKLQDLTRNDVSKYVEDFFLTAMKNGHFESTSQKQTDILKNGVVKKAEGVFIWVRYVLKSLVYGADRCSTWQELLQHLQACPAEMEDLYNEMWRRQNRSEDRYREEAAMYFHMVMKPPQGSHKHRKAFDACCVFDLMLARNPGVQERILATNKCVPLSDLVRLCEDTENRLAARCAGLVEISGNSGYASDSEEDFATPGSESDYTSGSETETVPSGAENDYAIDAEGEVECDMRRERESQSSDSKKVSDFIRQAHVRFIHRSAYDFLANTSEGQQLSGISKPTPGESLLARVRLNMAILLILGWDEGGYDDEDITDDLASVELGFNIHDVSDSVVVAAVKQITSSYARALNIMNADSISDQWNFSLTELKDYDYSMCYVDILGMATYLGLTPFVKAFAEQVGRGRRLRAAYADYLLLCACEGVRTEMVAWLLDRKANPNRPFYQPILTERERFLRIRTTPIEKCLERLLAPDHEAYGLVCVSNSMMHQLIGAGANLQESAIVALGPEWQVQFLDRDLLYFDLFQHDDYILMEIKLVDLLRMLAERSFYNGRDLLICPAGLSYLSRHSTRIARFVVQRGKIYQPNEMASDLIISAYDRHAENTQVLSVQFFQNSQDDGDYEASRKIQEAERYEWNKLVVKTVGEVIPQCREVDKTEMLSWLLENGWTAPDDYVPPFDIDNPFEDE